MTVNYNVVERGNPANPEAPKKFYASVVADGRVSERELAEMAARESTLSTMDMMAAYESLLALIPLLLAQGRIVDLGDFGSFWLRNSSVGCDTAGDVNETHITKVQPRFIPGKGFKKLLKTLDFSKA